ncbi:MAG: glycosyltransferase family 4 protein, partial [Caldilineaceae bacterium]
MSEKPLSRRIVLPVHHFPPRFNAGAENYTFELARTLQANDWTVEVVTIDAIDSGDPDRIVAERDLYGGVPVWRLRYNQIAAPARRLWDFDNPLLGDWFATYFRTTQPDLVHLQAGYLMGVAPVFAAAALQIPTVLTMHDYWYICPQHTLLRGDGSLCHAVPADPRECVWCRTMNERAPKALRMLGTGVAERLGPLTVANEGVDLMRLRRERTSAALRSVDRVITVSEFLASMVRATVPGVRVDVCRAGARDESVSLPRASRTRDAFNVGYLGQIAEHKGLHYLLDAFEQVRAPDRRLALHIFGGPLESPYARSLISRSAGNTAIQFHGAVAREQVFHALAELDVLVVPSIWFENAPLVVLEALMVGTPLVVSDLGGLREMFAEGVNGLRVPPRSSDAIARALQAMVDDAELLQRLQ